MAPVDPAHDQRVGPYAVDGVLGRGGMGVVFAARAPAEDQVVALKVSTAQANVASDLERLREARLLATLGHRHVARLLDVGTLSESATVAGVPLMAGAEWMVLERLGPTLWQVPPRSQHEAVTVILQLLDALAYTHAASVLHLDLTPRNLLWRRPGEIVVSDFGLGR